MMGCKCILAFVPSSFAAEKTAAPCDQVYLLVVNTAPSGQPMLQRMAHMMLEKELGLETR